MSSPSSSSAGDKFPTLTGSEDKESTDKEELVVSRPVEEKSPSTDESDSSNAKEESVAVQPVEETSPTLTSTDDNDSSNAKEESVAVQPVEEKSPTLTTTDDKDSSTVKELVDDQSAVEASTSKDGKEFVASTVQLSVRENILTLRSNDEQEFTVKESVAFKSDTIKEMAKRSSASSAIHLTNVNGKTLGIVLEYLNIKYGGSEASAEDKRKYEPEELAKKDLNDLLDVWCATEYLKIKEDNMHQIFYQATRDHIADIQMPDHPPLPDIENYPNLEEDAEENIRTEYPSDFDD